MPNDFHVGPFNLQWSMLSWIVCILAGYGFISFYLRGNKARREDITSVIGTGLLVFLLVWKFGVILSDFSILWKHPLGLFMYSGGQQEMYFGCIVAVIVVFYSMRNRNFSIQVLGDLIPMGMLSSVMAYQLMGWRFGGVTSLPWGIKMDNGSSLHFHPLNVYVLLAAIVCLVILLRSQVELGSGMMLSRFAIFFGIGMLFITLFAASKVSEGAILSTEQVGYALLVIFGMFSAKVVAFIDYSFIAHPKERRERVDMENEIINSPEQNNQEIANEKLESAKNTAEKVTQGEDTVGFVDKKLDGPNRPSV